MVVERVGGNGGGRAQFAVAEGTMKWLFVLLKDQ